MSRSLPTPTRHIPGSAGKQRVLRERFLLGLSLFNPSDARIPDGPEATITRSTTQNADIDYGRYLSALDAVVNPYANLEPGTGK